MDLESQGFLGIQLLPNDMLIEIFSHIKSEYSTFRRINKDCSKAKLPWDGWDAVIDQGFIVYINKSTIAWCKNGQYCSLGELPAKEYDRRYNYFCESKKDHRPFETSENPKTLVWYQNGVVHREGDLPAIEWSCGCREWWSDNNLHREGDLPAIEYYGHTEWRVHGRKHRGGGKPAVLKMDNTKEWWINGVMQIRK